MTAELEAARAAIVPVLEEVELELYDVGLVGAPGGRTLRVTVDSRRGGVDLEAIAEVTRLISARLDATDSIGGSYVLEVTSPGVERPLRTARHFESALGELVSVKHRSADGIRRTRGTVTGVSGSRVNLDTESGPVTIDVSDVTKARTVFDWSPAPKPGRGGSAGSRSDQRRAKERTRR